MIFIIKRKKLPKNLRKYIRQEKARIRRQVLDIEEQKRLIGALIKRFQKNERNPSL